MSNLDRRVYDAKHEVTRQLCNVISSDEQKHRYGIDQLPGAIDALNKAWDDMTTALVRQREERDRQIIRLINELAEARKE